jgi:phosphatidylinositol alpha-1,6-mannosyltransferase
VNLLVVGTDFPPNSGGISTYTVEVAGALAKTCKVIVLVPGATQTAVYDKVCSYKIVRTPAFPIFRILAFFLYLPWLIRRYHIDAVLHTVWPTALISHLWYYLIPIPYFVTVYASEILDDTKTLRRRLKSCLKSWRRMARVDPQRFKPAKNHQRGIGQKKLLTVARLDLHKGHDRVLEALAILKEQGITPRYIIVGEGDEDRRLRKIAKELGLEHQVEFDGFIPAGFMPGSRLPDIYADSDVFIMASREIPGRLDLVEGFGISFLEASASGLPVIAGRSGGVPDAVKDGETGLLVNPDDSRAIAFAIQRLLTDTDLAKRLGNEGRHWIETQMSWEHVAHRLLDAIKRLI